MNTTTINYLSNPESVRGDGWVRAGCTRLASLIFKNVRRLCCMITMEEDVHSLFISICFTIVLVKIFKTHFIEPVNDNSIGI